MISSLVLMPLSVSCAMLWVIARAVRIAGRLCWEVGMAVFAFYLQLCWDSTLWALAFFTLPLRLFATLYTQIKLEAQLREMRTRLEKLAGENKELEEYLLLAFKERKVLENVLQEMKDAQKKMLSKIDLLHNEIQYLKEENLGLRYARGKDLWDWKASNIKEGRVILQDIMIHGDQWGDDGKGRQPSPFEVQKIVAIRWSLFSVFLSLLVGLVIWEAEDPCLPLLAALFTVIGMSITSAVQFFFTVKNKPASDAVALLSINCFMLGTLTYPTLPSVAIMCASLATRAFDWLF